jgi:DMSO/TMAO reductase YedYZ molybdopterin-dependent catalytic subunit
MEKLLSKRRASHGFGWHGDKGLGTAPSLALRDDIIGQANIAGPVCQAKTYGREINGRWSMSEKTTLLGRFARAVGWGLAVWWLTACTVVVPTVTPTVTPSVTASPQPTVTQTATPRPTATATPLPTAEVVAKCALPTVVAPPTPDGSVTFGTLDPATGLHVTGRPQVIDPATYRLVVSGLVDHPLQLTYDDVRCLPKIQSDAALICVGAFEDYATWAGAKLAAVLDLAGVQAGAKDIKLISADEYVVVIPLDTAREPQNFLAYEVDGQTLPVLHGFPLRVVFPDLTGNKWLKWLVEINVY